MGRNGRRRRQDVAMTAMLSAPNSARVPGGRKRTPMLVPRPQLRRPGDSHGVVSDDCPRGVGPCIRVTKDWTVVDDRSGRLAALRWQDIGAVARHDTIAAHVVWQPLAGVMRAALKASCLWHATAGPVIAGLEIMCAQLASNVLQQADVPWCFGLRCPTWHAAPVCFPCLCLGPPNPFSFVFPFADLCFSLPRPSSSPSQPSAPLFPTFSLSLAHS